MLDLPSHQPKCDSGLYPPRLLLTVRPLDESQPTTDLICDLKVQGTVKPCCLRLEMKYCTRGRATQSGLFLSDWLIVSHACVQNPNHKKREGQAVSTQKVQ